MSNMNDNKFCPYDFYTLEEDTSSSNLYFKCICGYTRLAEDTETLLFEDMYDSVYIAEHLTAENIAEDEICQRVPIKCECGCLVANISIIGEEKRVVKICLKCKKAVN